MFSPISSLTKESSSPADASIKETSSKVVSQIKEVSSEIYSHLKAPSITLQEAGVTSEEIKIGAGGRYTGLDSQKAKEELGKILKFVGSDTKALDSGALRLVQNWDGSYELKRRTLSPYHWFSFLGWGRDIEAANTYVRGVMKVALGKEHPLDALSHHLVPPTKITAEEMVKTGVRLDPTLSSRLLPIIVARDIALEKTATSTSKSLLASVGGSLQLSRAASTSKEASYFRRLREILCTQLPALGITCGNKIGEGGYGLIYHATVKDGKENDHVIKIEQELHFEDIQAGEERLRFDQRGDLSAWAAKNLSRTQIIRPIFVIVALKKTPEASVEYHYLSASAATAFTEKMGKEYPQAQAALAAQLMECIEGGSLQKSCKENPKLFSDPSSWAFKNTLNGLLKYFKGACEGKVLQRDIKPGNILLLDDPKKEKRNDTMVKVADWGLAALGPSFSAVLGTASYASPRICDASPDQPYGPEVDGYSIAMTLLEMIDPEGMNWYRVLLRTAEREAKGNKVEPKSLEWKKDALRALQNFWGDIIIPDLEPPSEYLEIYMRLIRDTKGYTYPSRLEAKLQDTPLLQELIGRLFQVAAGGFNLEKNFEALCKKLDEFQKINGYKAGESEKSLDTPRRTSSSISPV